MSGFSEMTMRVAATANSARVRMNMGPCRRDRALRGRLSGKLQRSATAQNAETQQIPAATMYSPTHSNAFMDLTCLSDCRSTKGVPYTPIILPFYANKYILLNVLRDGFVGARFEVVEDVGSEANAV